MQKYKLVFNNMDTKNQELILLKGIDDYEEIVELCFIDRFTTKFEDEISCINYLKNKNIITSNNGYLSILRPNGTEKAEQIIYDTEFGFFSKEISDRKRINVNASRLKETYEQKKISNMIVNYFYNDAKALSQLCKTNFKNKNFNSALKEYIEISAPKGWTEDSEMARIISAKKDVYSMLKNYVILRNAYIWIKEEESYKVKRMSKGD